MRIYYLLTGLLLMHVVAFAQEKKFVIQGKLPTVYKKYNVLLVWNNGNNYEEATLLNGRFTVTGEIEEPAFATLSIEPANPLKGKKFNPVEFERNNLQLFLDEGTTTVTSSSYLSAAVVKGSAIVNEYEQYKSQTRHLVLQEQKLNELYNLYKRRKNNQKADSIVSLFDALDEQYYKADSLFVRDHPASPVSLYFTQKALGEEMDAAKASPLFAMLSTALQQSAKGISIQQDIETGKKSMIGITAANFTQPTADGTGVSLASFRGKYVLVDFWASWCIPCRAESPALVKAYEQFKGKNFDIFSVSIDEKKDKWLKAVKDDGYTWTQVSELRGWESSAASMYGVSAIPFNFLIDPNGVIIARNLRGDKLVKKLAELLK
jgi:thiol-disulfide isomerase/thioredoxin